jgi:hypothetical protein
MHSIKQSSAAVVASDTQDAGAAFDNALLAQARLCASFVEANSEVKLPMATSQRILQSMTDGMSGLVASRDHMTSVVRQLNLVQARSNLQTVSFGCPAGLPSPKFFGADAEPVTMTSEPIT